MIKTFSTFVLKADRSPDLIRESRHENAILHKESGGEQALRLIDTASGCHLIVDVPTRWAAVRVNAIGGELVSEDLLASLPSP